MDVSRTIILILIVITTVIAFVSLAIFCMVHIHKKTSDSNTITPTKGICYKTVYQYIRKISQYKVIFRNYTLYYTISAGHIPALKSCFKFGYDSVGNDLYDIPLEGSDNFVNCQYACQKHPDCEFFAFNMRGDPPENDGCWLKTKTRVPQPRPHVVLGPKHCTGVYIIHGSGYTP